MMPSFRQDCGGFNQWSYIGFHLTHLVNILLNDLEFIDHEINCRSFTLDHFIPQCERTNTIFIVHFKDITLVFLSSQQNNVRTYCHQ